MTMLTDALMLVPSRVDVGVPPAITDTARAVIAFHKPTPEGFCRGCLDQWARLAPTDCEPVRWARTVYAELGMNASGNQVRSQARGDYPDESR